MSKHQIASLFLYEKDSADTTLEAFRSESGEGEEKSELLGIIEINEKGGPSDKFLSSFISIVERAHEGAELGNPEVRLQYILEQANARLSQGEYKPKISAFLALLEGNALSFAAFGKMRALLVHPASVQTKIGTTMGKPTSWKVIELLDTSEARANLFRQVSSGSLREENILLVSTNTLFDVLSLEYLKNTLTNNPPASAVERLEGFLSELPTHLPFAAFIIHGGKGQVPLADTEVAEASEESLERLVTRKNSTQKILAPVLGARTKQYLAALASEITRFAAAFGKMAVKGISRLMMLLKRGNNREKNYQKITKRFHIMPSFSKKLLALFAVLFLLFLWGVNISRQKASERKLTETYLEKVAEAEETYNQAKASLIYENEEKAQKQLLEAEKTLKELPAVKEKNEQREKREELSSKITQELEKLRKISSVSSPKRLVEFSKEIIESPKLLVGLSPDLLVFSADKAVKVKTDGKTEEVKGDVTDGKARWALLRDQNRVLVVKDTNTLQEFDLAAGTTGSVEWSFPSGRSIQDIVFYNQRLYILDSTSNQIWRHLPSEKGFDAGGSWIQEENIDLKKSRAMAIDGSLYLVDARGEFQKFTLGKKEEFLVLIDPTPVGVKKIWTNPDSKFLYLLDPSSRRLVVVDKEEKKTVVQYSSPELKDLQDFAVDEKAKKIFLLTSKEIFEIEATHLAR